MAIEDPNTILLHSNRNEEYIRSILIGSSDNVISHAERSGNVKARLRLHSKIKQRSHGFIKTLAEQNCMAKNQ